MNAAELIVEALQERHHAGDGAVIVVALDGRSGAGKSTVATAIAQRVDAAVVRVDDFYRDLTEADRLALSPAEGVDEYFDWQRLRREALVPLAERRRAKFSCFDWVAGSGLSGEATLDPRDILIVEGVYAARPEFDDLVDLKVLVEAAEEERERRRRERHDPHAWEERWDAAERHYFAEIRPPSAFDLVVAGDT